jgi:hypothetical protein
MLLIVVVFHIQRAVYIAVEVAEQFCGGIVGMIRTDGNYLSSVSN